LARKIEVIVGLNLLKKLRKKRTPSTPTNKLYGLRIRKKHAESASAESKLRFFSTSARVPAKMTESSSCRHCHCGIIADIKPLRFQNKVLHDWK